MTSKLSFIIPTLNEEKVLAATLQKLRKLTVCSYEIIVSDGHSTDRTVEIARHYADVVLEHDGKRRQNIAQGRNEGAATAKGEYLVFLDADVEMLDMNAFFTKAQGVFQKSNSLVGLGGFVRVLPNLAWKSDVIIMGILNRVWAFMNNTLGVAGIGGEFQMIKAEAFRKVGGFDEKLIAGEDFDLFTRIARYGKTHVESSLSVYHTGRRVHKVGWAKLLWTWFLNWFSMKLFHRAVSEEWKVIR